MSVFIIAEAGVNHNGSLETAKKMVDVAKNAGVDCIKFQTFVSKLLVAKNAEKADYQKEQTLVDESQYEMLKKLELSFDEFKALNDYCKERGILFMSTAFDMESIDFLESLNMSCWKIPSGEITNLPYLEKIAKVGKPIILSTGMCDLNDIKAALFVLTDNGAEDITVLHCTSEYPAPYEEVNLLAMHTIKETFNVKIGYSDHTKGIEIPIAAVALGATVIEKHFTLDPNMEGPDHRASIDPSELQQMVTAIRHVEVALGNGVKLATDSEKRNSKVARKSIVAKCAINKGDLLTENNLTVKRPGNGITPMRWYDVVGTKAIKDFSEDDLIEL